MFKKVGRLFAFVAICLFVTPIVTRAAEVDYEFDDGSSVTATEVGTYTELKAALEAGENVSLTNDITVEKPISVIVAGKAAGKLVYIFGENHTISGEGMTNEGANGSIITAHAGTLLYFFDTTITKANKYGLQAYNTGTIVVNNVTITDCNYGAILVNGGGLVVASVTMGNNGAHPGGNGIELGKASGLTKDPLLVMAGTINLLPGNQTSAITLAENDSLQDPKIVNNDGTKEKLEFKDNKLNVLAADGTVKYQSNELKAGATLEVTSGPSYIPIISVPNKDNNNENVTPTETAKPTVQPDTNAASNPNTYDGILVYAILAIAALSTLVVGTKKAFSK